MKCTLIVDQERMVPKTVGRVTRTVFETVPAGTLVDHPEAYIKCLAGAAIPADDECAFAMSGLTLLEWEQKHPGIVATMQARYAEVNAGIHPEDLALFRAGKIVGYRAEYDPNTEPPSMQFVVGPNWTDEDRAAIDEEIDEDDDAEEPTPAAAAQHLAA